MFINKLNQLYKPGRILYYIPASREEIDDFYRGRVSGSVAKYNGAFGTYDNPGLFYTKKTGGPVIGIEFRAGDDRIEYPEDLGSVFLDESYFYSVEMDKDGGIDYESVRSIFDGISGDDDAHRLYTDLSLPSSDPQICIFSGGGKIRILYECKVDNDRADDVISGKSADMDRSYLYKMAFTDPITGHYNWNHLVAFLEMPSDSGINDYAFVHFDVKEFRVINEVYGHIAANNVLSAIVEEMKNSDLVYASSRCHNDNFAMMVKDMPEQEMIHWLEGFFERLSHLEEDRNYRIYYRAGVVPMQRAMLLGNRVADAGKMAQAMGTSHNKTDITIYTEKMHDEVMWGNYIKAYLDTAIERDEFVVHLQPKYDIRTEKIKGAEALVRWNYRSGQFLPPYRFIPFFERDGSIGKVDDIVLAKVCERFAAWKKEGKPLYPISVNLSRNRLYDPGIISYLTGIVDSYDVDHSLIDFELTESATYDDRDRILSVLGGLRAQGFLISMDDFGTGYSSLSLLTEMPLDTLKIDKSFVDKIGTDNDSPKDIVVIRHIVELAKELNFVCLAEGAETKAQADKLSDLGCDVIQGYYYSRPVPIEEYEKML
ncbi:MAG: GGDEF domain-containing phosphodiesterase [Lachnospiraceae bacterium]|nr:GGDEF domain-containing phosphodiesterase [Lachnospiraceae bacterium]